MTTRRRRGWEQRLLAAMAYPANLALGGVAAFILALPVLTAVPAVIALGRAYGAWLREGDDAVFTGTFREFAATWRRTLPLGAAGAVVVALLVVNATFLLARLEAGPDPLALVLAPATAVVGAAVTLLLLGLPVAAHRSRDAGVKQWLAESGYLVARRPVRALTLLAIVAAFGFTCGLLPTIVPFLGLSVPVYLAHVSLGQGDGTERGGGTGPEADRR
ncbi:hypothetical protein [Occultella gossypii]|uniref:DUF624 domain-containing protein n=1 Tax=Occultella gossypii TaxID=2800820 RepID=A0ABS7SH90_9MICO|nr:hypothetical protein [Occultella gossypii]MBZ2199698.1 hypothetical protein [Occultella gossypii]